jgi:hypothetical protein
MTKKFARNSKKSDFFLIKLKHKAWKHVQKFHKKTKKSKNKTKFFFKFIKTRAFSGNA